LLAELPQPRTEEPNVRLSVIVPVYNEERNIAPLVERLIPVLEAGGWEYEVIFVNDGSIDGSAARLDEAAARNARVRVLHFRRNYGQSAAMMAGIDASRGEILVPIDADLQNDPADIPKLLEKIAEGGDVVSGWRRDRQDEPGRVLVSRIANRLISAVTGVRLHDYGCTLKAYRRSVLHNVRLYGEMHRFIPIYASWEGAQVVEVPVAHHPRLRGRSKYGYARTLKVILDLIYLKFMSSFGRSPIYFFGGGGLLSIFASLVSFAYMLYLKIFAGKSFVQTPMPLLCALFFLVGVICVQLGLIAEILMRTYFESQGKTPYAILRRVNFSEADPQTPAT
jgi:glycosyltransferase involved in cell wall biosynthesis